MNATTPSRRRTLRPLLRIALVTATCLAAAMHAPAKAAAGEALRAAAEKMAPDYRAAQVTRLAGKGDRDSLIAAVLVGMPDSAAQMAVHASFLQRTASEHTADPLAVYAAALACHAQALPCIRDQYQAALLKLEPDNAISHLLLPNGAVPTPAQIARAAASAGADSHFSELLGLVRTALAGQPAPGAAPAKIDAGDLALELRRGEVGRVPWPKLGPAMGVCNADLASQPKQKSLQRDCAQLGAKLLADKSQNLVTMMFGSTLVRRFARGSSQAEAGLALRRNYVWLSEAQADDSPAAGERLNEEEISLGEWEAFQRAAERTGVTRTPPAGWTPKNPELLLLPEERTPPPSAPLRVPAG